MVDIGNAIKSPLLWLQPDGRGRRIILILYADVCGGKGDGLDAGGSRIKIFPLTSVPFRK